MQPQSPPQQTPREAQALGLSYLADTIPQAQAAFLAAETLFDQALDKLLEAKKCMADMRDANAALEDRLPGNDRLEDAVDQLKRAEDVLSFQVISVIVEQHSICSFMARMLAMVQEMDQRHKATPDGPKRANTRPLKPPDTPAQTMPTTPADSLPPDQQPTRYAPTIPAINPTPAEDQ